MTAGELPDTPQGRLRAQRIAAMGPPLIAGDTCPGTKRPAAPANVGDALGFVCPVCHRPQDAGGKVRKHALGALELAELREGAEANARALRSALRHLDLAAHYAGEAGPALAEAIYTMRSPRARIEFALDDLTPYLGGT